MNMVLYFNVKSLFLCWIWTVKCRHQWLCKQNMNTLQRLRLFFYVQVGQINLNLQLDLCISWVRLWEDSIFSSWVLKLTELFFFLYRLPSWPTFHPLSTFRPNLPPSLNFSHDRSTSPSSRYLFLHLLLPHTIWQIPFIFPYLCFPLYYCLPFQDLLVALINVFKSIHERTWPNTATVPRGCKLSLSCGMVWPWSPPAYTKMYNKKLYVII